MNIIYIEDNKGDVLLFETIMKEICPCCNLITFTNGERALRYLYYLDSNKLETKVDLILIDFHLPGMDGDDILYTIKHDKILREIPVVMFSRSRTYGEQAIVTGALKYIEKSPDIDVYKQNVQKIFELIKTN